MHHVVGADALLKSGFAVDDLVLGVVLLVERDARNGQVVLLERAGDRLGGLRRRVDQAEELLVALHAGAVPLAQALVGRDRGVVFEQVGVVVRTQIKLDQLRELADGRGQVAPESEVAERDLRHAAVGVHLHAGLDAPEVGVLVEVPVGACGVVLAGEIPVGTVERLPDFVQRVVVADILVGLVERDADLRFGGLVVLDGEVEVLGPFVGLQQQLVLVVGLVPHHFVAAGLERKQRVAFERRGLVAERVVVLVEMDRELRGQHLEGRLFVGLALFYGEADEGDLVEGILPVCRTGDGRLGEVRKVLADGEAHFSARFDIDRQVVDLQAAGFDDEPVVEGHAVVYQLVVRVVEREGDDLVLPGQQPQLLAAQAELGALLVGGRERQRLGDGRAVAAERHLHLGGFVKVVELGFLRPADGVVGRLLVEFELDVSVVEIAVVDAVVVGTSAGEGRCQCENRRYENF